MASKCVTCGKPVRGPFKGTPVHSQACGHLLALRLVDAVPDVLKLLPAQWRQGGGPSIIIGSDTS